MVISALSFSLYAANAAFQVNNIIVIYPTFTQSAYDPGGFYSCFHITHNPKCKTIPIDNSMPGGYSSSREAYYLLKNNYKIISDIELNNNPHIIDSYRKVIVLHNEYVTQTEFNAILNHPNVLYLYPNSLYAKIQYNENNNTITLIRGHNYPQGISNGFGWIDDHTKEYEKNNKCQNISFIKVSNGYYINCYPEEWVLSSIDIAKMILK